MLARSKQVITRIKNFDAKMRSNLKAGEKISIDSSVWNLEALQNLTYAFPDSAMNDFKVMKSNYTIGIDDNGMVLMSDVQSVYTQMEDSLLYKYGQITSDAKVLRFSDVALDSIVGRTAYLSATFGFAFNILSFYLPFEDDDDWLWGTLTQTYGDPPLGKCNGTEYGVSDGSDELQRRLNNPYLLFDGQYTFTDLETVEATGYDYNERLYVGWDYPENNCLTNDLLDYYLVQSHNIINNYSEGLRIEGKSFASVQIDDDLLIANYPKHFHYYYVTYGIRILIGNQTN
jgi:hypothetical protein